MLADGVNHPQPRQRDRRPEELDEVVAQLHNLGGLGLTRAAGGDGRPGGAAGRDNAAEKEHRPLIMDDDEDEGVSIAADGTLLASTPARPL